MLHVGRYFISILIALNQTANALTGGDPQTSPSARLGDARDHGHRFAKVACAVLEKIDFHDPARADHCTMAQREHRERLERGLIP